MISFIRPAAAVCYATLLAGCAGLSGDGGRADVARLTQERIAQAADFSVVNDNGESVLALLAQPLTPESTVQIALRNNAALKAALAGLGVAESEWLQAGTLRNPGVSFGRIRGGADTEIDRSIVFDIAGLLTMPARTRIAQGRFEQAKLQVAAQAVQLATDSRRAFFMAVAANQSAAFAQQVLVAAEASAELAQNMAKAGNWSKLDQARERAFYHDAVTQLARRQHEATVAREQLIRLLGLTGEQVLTLPERLPDLPAQPQAIQNAEAQALTQRLDMLAARRDTEATAEALGLSRTTGLINVFDAGYANKSSTGAARENGYQVSFELPLFDWGSAKVARAQAVYMESVQHAAETAQRARSEVRVAYSSYRSSYAIARHYRDEVVPLRKQISDEVLLRYNGMLASVFELLADSREQLSSVNTAIETQRDFWIAETELQAAIHGGTANPTRSTP